MHKHVFMPSSYMLIKTYLNHLNPNNPALFQWPKSESSAKFNPKVHEAWYDACNVGHNTLENMLRKMTERAGITPYLTNHSLRATTVTVLSSSNIETRQIKAITGNTRAIPALKAIANDQHLANSRKCQRR
jgi:integrase